MNLIFRDATETDLPQLVEMLEDDFLAKGREDLSIPLNPAYLEFLERVSKNPDIRLIVAELAHELVGMLQITFIPQFHYIGSWTCELECVRVSSQRRGQGIGGKMLHWSIEQARKRGCRSVQLTTNLSRIDAIRFYEKEGFAYSHAGMKFSIQ
ncbi:MAG: GNAT family N-acetyltransferase [Verrucomicrobiota bacterium]